MVCHLLEMDLTYCKLLFQDFKSPLQSVVSPLWSVVHRILPSRDLKLAQQVIERIAAVCRQDNLVLDWQ